MRSEEEQRLIECENGEVGRVDGERQSERMTMR